jgi:hypothetical protein
MVQPGLLHLVQYVRLGQPFDRSYAQAFHITGPQIVGGDGGAPQWVADVLAAHPEIEEIAVNRGGSGVCYARMPANAPAEARRSRSLQPDVGAGGGK